MRIIESKFKKLADICWELFRIAKIPMQFSNFSNKIYTTYQKLYLLVYKQARKFTYEELMTDLSSNLELRGYLGLVRLPDYTTLIKFSKKIPYALLDRMVWAFKKLVKRPVKVAIDATGLSLDNASPHYCKRIGLPFKKRPFMKCSVIVDIEDYIILAAKLRKKPRHDTVDGKKLTRKLANHYEPEVFYADRGYDDNTLFKIVFEELGAYPLIFQKNQDVPKHKRSGEYRKRTFPVFDYGEYLQRNKVETTFSMLKRRFGFSIRSRCIKTQRVEAITRMIAFNLDRVVRMSEEVILRIFAFRLRVSY